MPTSQVKLATSAQNVVTTPASGLFNQPTYQPIYPAEGSNFVHQQHSASAYPNSMMASAQHYPQSSDNVFYGCEDETQNYGNVSYAYPSNQTPLNMTYMQPTSSAQSITYLQPMNSNTYVVARKSNSYYYN